MVVAALLVGLDFAQGEVPGATEALKQTSANPLSLFDNKLTFDLQERARVEAHDNNFDFNSAKNASTDDTFLLQRFRLGALLTPVPWFKAYVQGQDTREIESTRQKVPFVLGAEGDDPFDLRQGYVEVGTADLPLVAKIGRQELVYGDERLICNFDWNNFSRTFDAVKLRFQDTNRAFWVDAFAAHVVTIDGSGPSANDSWRFNESNWGDTFAGLYGSTSLVPNQTTDLYFLYRNKASNDPVYQDTLGDKALPYDIKQEIYTIGLRMKSTPGQLRGFDYELEGAYQFGRDAGRVGTAYPNTAGQSLAHSAFAAESRAGYTFEELPWKPRLGLEYSVASGDSNPNDSKDGSFLNLFPTNHKFYGFMDLFAWKNIHDPSVGLKLAPLKKLTVQLDGHGFWLYTTQDAWYRANGVTQVRPVNAAARNASPFCGSELDLTVGYTPVKWLKFLAGYSHFFAGQYLADTETATAGASDADFGYVQMTVSF